MFSNGGSMQTASLVMNSDQVNRYGTRFPLDTLYSVLRQGVSGTPMFVSHDMHRPIGWSRAVGIALHAGVNYLLGSAAFPSGTEEEEALNARVRQYLAQKLEQVSSEHQLRLEEAAGIHLRRDSANFMSRECATLVQDGIAKSLFPDFFPKIENDKRELIQLSKLKVVGPGVYEVRDGICVFAHRYLRRSASRWNNLNMPFLQRFQEAAHESADFDARIALDPDAIGLPDTYRQAIELEYWWGPKFNDDLSQIDTQITRHQASPRERMFHRIDRTEFWWYDQSDLRSFECEEVVDGQTLGIDGADRYACRYAHSMVDLAKNIPHHLDGAVRIYDDEQIIERVDLNMAQAGRRSEYVKLWRADGVIPVPLWKALLSDYFRDNYLVSEYLGAEVAPSDAAAQGETPKPKWPAPLELTVETSPAFLVSPIPKFEAIDKGDLRVRRDDFLTKNGERRATVDLVTLDVLKLLESSGLRVQKPEAIMWLAFEDMHAQLPRMQVASTAVASSACGCLASWLRTRGQLGGAAISGTLDFAGADEGLRLAFIGAPERLAAGFEILASANASAFEDGLRLLDTLQPAGISTASVCPEVLESVREDTTFDLGRKFIPESTFQEVPGGAVVLVRREAAERLGLADAIEAKELFPVPVFEVAESTCDSCQGSYFACLCVGSQTVANFMFVGGVLTRHPAREMPGIAQLHADEGTQG